MKGTAEAGTKDKHITWHVNAQEHNITIVLLLLEMATKLVR